MDALGTSGITGRSKVKETRAAAIAINTTTSNTSITTITTITIIPKDMKMKFSRKIEGKGELNHYMPSVYSLSKRVYYNISRTI